MIKIEKKIWLPIVIWLSMFLFIFNIANYFQSAKDAFANAAYETVTSCAAYYITALFLFPKFYNNRRGYFWTSIFVMAGIALILFVIDIYFISEFRGGDKHEKPPLIFQYMRYFFSLGFVFFVATSVSLMEHTTKLMESEKVLTEEKLETELKLLKAQINPHFIFNALNNIYSLTYMQSKNAPDSVLKLSDMLRYVFYDCNKDKVPLSAEVKYIENFTAFQQMKSEFAQNISLTTDVNGASTAIAPMLFIPLIENAFKYSRIEENEEAYVHIKMGLNDGKLNFGIENNIAENKPGSGSGMGITNVKHRLDIIYPGKYKLNIEENKNIHTVLLSVDIV